MFLIFAACGFLAIKNADFLPKQPAEKYVVGDKVHVKEPGEQTEFIFKKKNL